MILSDENELIAGVGPLMVYPPTTSTGAGRLVRFTADDRFVIQTGDGPRLMLVADDTEVIIFDTEIELFGGLDKWIEDGYELRRC